MSRLYAWVESDTRGTELTTRGNRFIRVQVNYGSKYNSKKAVILYVEYPEDTEKPKICINASVPIKIS